MKQSDLFNQMRREAVISECSLYRYELRRTWDLGRRHLPVCMLNPSTADHLQDDPTIRTLIHFGRLWGYGGVIIVNLFAYRSSTPEVLLGTPDPVGPKNGQHLVETLEYAAGSSGKMLAAWGNGGTLGDRASLFCSSARGYGVDLVCLGTTKDGNPKHPLARGQHRIPRDQQPILWRGAASA